MNEKKKRMIETAIDLFAQKSFHTVSVKEITDKSGVSKGAFYIYFDSKEDLVLAIYKYYYQVIMDRIIEVGSQHKDPKQSLIEQLNMFFETLFHNRSFILMLLRDQVSLGPKVKEMIYQIKDQQMEWAKNNLRAIYGSQIQPYILDGAIILQGLMHSYSNYMVIEHHQNIDLPELSRFIVKRLDDCVQGMIQSKEPPVIQEIEKTDDLEHMLDKVEVKFQSANIPPEQRRDLTEALSVLKRELVKNRPNPIIVQAMLNQFQSVQPLKEVYKSLINHHTIQAMIHNQRSDYS
ncbi:TetR family transcriptional regulator [Melghiribacillus thermohalophilus]|uniref:TetR family transcriptional regulator n=1 Tax=Melghiribacillus thermohalophilus TaxID=1324956 RepID=A0A4R3NAY1_9BACI|nr:TetR/AcrR family transcriptional regulator [Melghiribacillus thermohalophilus]TCT26439.1 TetR family transcriptional regulator [Melghiribacillus thermohalophilus]